MAQVLRSLDEPITHTRGTFRARVVGRAAEDGMWEGWMEFVPTSPGVSEVVVSSIESRQPELEHLQYWADGLTVVYAEGALDRALHPVVVRTSVTEIPASERPARRVVTKPRVFGPEPILDPFEIGGRSLDILRQELHALDRPRLINIIEAYALNPGSADLTTMSNQQLIALIVVAIDTQITQSIR